MNPVCRCHLVEFMTFALSQDLVLTHQAEAVRVKQKGSSLVLDNNNTITTTTATTTATTTTTTATEILIKREPLVYTRARRAA